MKTKIEFANKCLHEMNFGDLTTTECIAKYLNEFAMQEKQKEAIEFQGWTRVNYNQCTTGYIHNNWSGEPDKLVIYTTVELYELFQEWKLKNKDK